MAHNRTSPVTISPERGGGGYLESDPVVLIFRCVAYDICRMNKPSFRPRARNVTTTS